MFYKKMTKTIKVSDETYERIKDQIEENKVKEKEEKRIEIKNRWTGKIIWTSNKTTLKEAVEEAANEADLYGAILCKADLRGAELSEAILCEADLRGADLREAELREADLCGANLSGADLSKADLNKAYLREAELYGADLYESDLSEADLSKADLSEAELSEAELYGARFYGKGGTTRIKKSQVDDFFKALGIIVED